MRSDLPTQNPKMLVFGDLEVSSYTELYRHGISKIVENHTVGTNDKNSCFPEQFEWQTVHCDANILTKLSDLGILIIILY